MTTSNEATESRGYAPYVSFTAFQKLLRRMEEEGAPPGRVDRSYLSGMSGGYQAQILGTLRSLGLIDTEGEPTGDLHDLIQDLDAELPGFMQRQIALLYPEANALPRGTSGQLEQIFRQAYGVQGSTLEGAIRFYLDACRFAGVPVSPHFKAPTRSRKTSTNRGSSATPQSKRVAPSRKLGPVVGAPTTTGPMGSSTERVELSSGGHLVLTMSLDLFALSQSDREFVFDLVDRVKGYQSVSESPADDSEM